MSTTTNDLTEAQPGDEIETDHGPATVIAAADSADELVERIERMIEEGRR